MGRFIPTFTEDLKSAIAENVTTIVNYDPKSPGNSVAVDTYESGIQIQLDSYIFGS